MCLIKWHVSPFFSSVRLNICNIGHEREIHKMPNLLEIEISVFTKYIHVYIIRMDKKNN